MRQFYTLSCFATLLACAASGQTSHKAPAKHPAAPTHTAAQDLPPVPLPDEPGTYTVIYTSMGNIVCRLFPTEAPKTVDNFVGLATGTKKWTDPKTGKQTQKPLYSGTTFHRVIPDFMIQGGDPSGDGTGFPGYEIPDEISPDRKFEKPGVLAMANHGPNTNGSQFFITVAPSEHLNGNYSIFGEVVSGQDVADAISKVPRNGDDRPDTPVVIKAIAIRTVKATTPASTPPK